MQLPRTHGSLQYARSNPLFADVVRRCPKIDRVRAHNLARAWSRLQDRIISRMFDLCEKEVGLSLHISQRPDAAFELAKLLMFLGGRILDEKARLKPLADYNPASEVALLESVDERAKINLTARNLADCVWKPLIAKWRKQWPLIETPGQSGRRPRVRKAVKRPFREHLHYVPQFTTRQWAKSGRFLAYTIGVDGEVWATATPAKHWGVAPSLYTQGLEDLLGLIEGDAREPYDKLANTVPLNDIEMRRWVAFLVSQLIRTPRFMRMILHRQKAWIEQSGFNYPMSPAHLGRAFETLFQNNDFYAAFYRLVVSHAWAVMSAADSLTFLKGDNPVVLTGRKADTTWRLAYPLTPTRCFIAGPALEDEPGRIIPRQHRLTEAETAAVNAATCRFAETSVIGFNPPGRIDPRPTIKANLPKAGTLDAVELPLWGLDRQWSH
jgi:hypothetical protein